MMLSQVLIVTVIFFCFASFIFASFPQPLVYPRNCKSGEYFDVSHLICQKCGKGDDQQEKYQMKSADGLSCVCKPQYRQTKAKASSSITCEPCPREKVLSLDGSSCISCSSSSPYNSTLNACTPCPNNAILNDAHRNAENKTERRCIPCPSNAWPDETATRCIKCPEDFLVASQTNCSCPKDKYSNVGGFCLLTSELPLATPSLFTVQYNNGEEVHSAYLLEIQAVSYNCRKLNNMTACQILGNMCVLLNYKMDEPKSPSDSDACLEYLKLTSSTGRPMQRPPYAPWLYYLSDNARTELSKTNVPNIYKTGSKHKSSIIMFMAARYSTEGYFLGFSQLKPGELQLCQDTPESLASAFQFGTFYQQQCKRHVQDLWNSSHLVFYDLYLYGNNTMYPVPVLVEGMKKNGVNINQSPLIDSWQLVRRFFLTDAVSGVEADTQSDSIPFPKAKVFRFAQHITLTVTLRSSGQPGSIYPPLLSVKYAEMTRQDYSENLQVPITFSVIYKMDADKAHQDISIAMGVLSAIATLWAMFQTWSWARRSSKQAIDIVVVGKLLVLTSGQLANVFLLVTVSAALNWLILVKKQDVIHTLLPVPPQEDFFKVYLAVAFVLKVFQLVHELFQISTISIFFIDWERPRMRHPSGHRSGLGTSSQVRSGQTISSIAGDASRNNEEAESLMMGETTSVNKAGMSTIQTTRSSNVKQTPDKQQQLPVLDAPGVSIWRTYFVANEWAEIQVHRRVNQGLQLVGVLFILKVLGFENLAISDPLCNFSQSESQKHTSFSLIGRLAIGAITYIGVALIQVVFRKMIHERFFEDKLQQFVDLCSVSNVSVFVLMTKKYGYYIHGRSAQGRADVNMKEMHELLRREEEDLCSRRGLLPNTEQQTFQMSLPVEVYDQYKRILLPLGLYRQAADRMQGVGGRLSRVDIDRVVQTYTMLNRFLSGFIEHAFKDVDYVVKDKLPLEMLLDVEFFDTNERGTFYNDSGHSFDAALFCGHESTLVTFEVLLLCIIDLASQNFVLSAILTFVIGKLIQTLTHGTAKRNLVRKALVDERFLT